MSTLNVFNAQKEMEFYELSVVGLIQLEQFSFSNIHLPNYPIK